MKYSEASLDLAISTLLPHVRKANGNEIILKISRVNLLKDIAVEYFLKKTPPTQEEMICFSIARQAISDLTQYGAMKFGDKELSAEIDMIHQPTPMMQSPCSLN
jgi:hypothetical protein